MTKIERINLNSMVWKMARRYVLAEKMGYSEDYMMALKHDMLLVGMTLQIDFDTMIETVKNGEKMNDVVW